MSNFQTGFKKDIFNTIFQLTGKVWVKITIAYAILSILNQVFVNFIGLSSFQNSFSDPQLLSNPDALRDLFINYASNFTSNNLFLLMIPFGIISILISLWIYNFSFIVSDEAVKNNVTDFTTIAKKSLNKGVFKILGAGILIYLIMLVAIIIAIASIIFSGFLGFLLVISVFVFMNKFILVLPAFIIGNKSLGASFSFSFQYITWIRALKLFGYSILAFLALIIFALIIGLFSALLSMIPFIGIVIQIGVSAIMGGIMTSLSVALMVGLYYRYSENIDLEEDDQYIIDELQES